jgi:hypothetical protein
LARSIGATHARSNRSMDARCWRRSSHAALPQDRYQTADIDQDASGRTWIWRSGLGAPGFGLRAQYVARGLPPSLKLRRTTVALAEVVSPRVVFWRH